MDDLEALLSAVRNREPGAWKALYPRLSQALRVFYRRSRFDEPSAAELTQRTLTAVLNQLPGSPPPQKTYTKWAFGVARNQGRLELRARAKCRALSELADAIVKTPNTSPTARVHADELREMLLEEIEKLPPQYRRVIEHDLENDGSIDDHELARREGIKTRTVWTRRHRAIALLRDGIMRQLNPPRSLPRVADSTSSSSSPPA